MKKYFGTVTDREGTASSGAEVHVKIDATGALATIYSDNGVTTTANPTSTDNNGYFEFFVADGVYELEFFTGGIEQRSVAKIQIFDDQDNEIAALRSVTAGVDKLFYFTGPTTADVTTLTGYMRTLLDDADAATARVTLGVDTAITAAIAANPPTESLIIACSDETTALTAGTGKITFRMPYPFTLTGVRASLVTAQVSGSIFTVDLNEAGTSVLSTKLTVDNTEKTSTTAATAAVISDSALADDAEMSIDIDQIGDGTAKGLKVTLIGHR